MISHIRQFCVAADCERLLERAMAQQGPTARAHDRIRKDARTIADRKPLIRLGLSTWPKPFNIAPSTGTFGPRNAHVGTAALAVQSLEARQNNN